MPDCDFVLSRFVSKHKIRLTLNYKNNQREIFNPFRCEVLHGQNRVLNRFVVLLFSPFGQHNGGRRKPALFVKRKISD